MQEDEMIVWRILTTHPVPLRPTRRALKMITDTHNMNHTMSVLVWWKFNDNTRTTQKNRKKYK